MARHYVGRVTQLAPCKDSAHVSEDLATTIGALVVAAGLAVVPSSPPAQAGPAAAATAPGAFRAAPVDWKRCKDPDLREAKAQCGYLVVPLDYANPTGPTIQLAVSRVLHTKGPFRGAAFANPGGPGGSALHYSRLGGPSRTASARPTTGTAWTPAVSGRRSRR